MTAMLAWFGALGGYEFLLLLAVALLLFSSRIPAVARSIGQGLVEFKRAFTPSDPDSR